MSCELCHTNRDLEYCNLCKKWFCRDCKRKYPQRVAAMMRQKVFDPIGDLFGALGIK